MSATISETVCGCPACPHDRDTETVGISEKQFSLLGSYVQAVVELAVDIQHNFECDCFQLSLKKIVSKCCEGSCWGHCPFSGTGTSLVGFACQKSIGKHNDDFSAALELFNLETAIFSFPGCRALSKILGLQMKINWSGQRVFTGRVKEPDWVRVRKYFYNSIWSLVLQTELMFGNVSQHFISTTF